MRGVAFYMNGPAFMIAVLTFPSVLLGNTAGFVIAGVGATATWPWWRPTGRVVNDGVLVTRGLYLPKRQRVRLADIESFDLVVVNGPITWDGGAAPCGGVTAVTAAGERIPVVESSSWSGAHAQRWFEYLTELHGAARQQDGTTCAPM